MTLEQLQKLRRKWSSGVQHWSGLPGEAVKDVLRLLDAYEELLEYSSKLAYDAELLKSIIESGAVHEQE